MSDDYREKYDAVKAKFEGHFIIKRNVIFERAKFNLRVQKEGESADNFITDLYTLAEHCQFGALHDELIRDRIVVGLRDKALSEKLQLESSLTLEKAINQARQKELIRQQQGIIRPRESPVNVDRINVKGQNKQSLFKQKQYSKSDQSNVDQNCGRCGGPPHKRMNCPSRDSVCILCRKKGHWKMVCRSKKVNEVLTDDDMEELFLGEVIDAVEANQLNSWKADIAINDKIIKFKIDSGADVSVLPYDVYNKLKKQTELELEPTNKVLLGPCNYKLNCIGKFKAKLSTNHKSVHNEVFVVKGLQRPLLRRQVSQSLNLINKIDAINKKYYRTDIVEQYPKLFKGLGEIEGEYEIKLNENSKPFALTVPRKVSLSLLSKGPKPNKKLTECSR